MPEYTKQVPAGCKQCDGPLMYDPDRYVSPTGVIYKYVGARGYQIVGNTTRPAINWADAHQQLADGQTVPMETIFGFYNKEQANVNRQFLIAYYFVEKLHPDGKAVNKIDRSGDVISTNLIWANASAKVRSTRKNKGMTTIEYAALIQEEKAIAGGKSKPEKVVYQVGTTNMQILQEIDNVNQFVSKNANFVAKPIYTAAAKCGEYQGYLWLDKSNVDKYYTITNNTVSITISLSDAMQCVYRQIHDLLTSGAIKENMIKIDADGTTSASDDLANILNKLDPRGQGDLAYLGKYTNDLENRMQCGYALSFHGNTKTQQMAICLNTLIVFLRSKENLGPKSPACPICQCGERTVFKMDKPECSIPVYKYNTAVATDPYAFQQEYLTMADILMNNDGTMKPNGRLLQFLRESLFGKSSGSYPNGEPKRKKVLQSYIFSFYPPRDEYLHEVDPSWFLQRRLNAQLFQEMRKAALN